MSIKQLARYAKLIQAKKLLVGVLLVDNTD